MTQKKINTITRQATRPTSVVIMLLILQAITMAAPDAIPEKWEDFAINAITVIGGTGILDKIWRNRHKIKDLFTRKKGGKNEKFEGSPEQDTSGC